VVLQKKTHGVLRVPHAEVVSAAGLVLGAGLLNIAVGMAHCLHGLSCMTLMHAVLRVLVCESCKAVRTSVMRLPLC
jgi:hypothetical protein